MKLFKKAKKGFTLVELVVVIAVIAILAAVSVGAYFGVTDSANRSKLEQEAKQAYTNIQLVSLVDSKDGFDLDIDGLSIDKLDDFEREVAKAGGDYDLRDSNESINENKPTVIFSETAVQAENTTKTYKQFDYYIPTISGMHANCNLLNGGKITIVKGDNPVFGEESNTPVVPEEPDHEHEFINGKCSCGEPDPNYEPPHEHTFVKGECTGCGEPDPNYRNPITGLSINGEEEVTLTLLSSNDTYEINTTLIYQDQDVATTDTDYTISYTSSVTAFATVSDSGVVKAKGTGESVITATVKVGEEVRGSDLIKVIVNKVAVSVSFAEDTRTSFFVGEETYKFEASASGTNLSDTSVTWSAVGVEIEDDGTVRFGNEPFEEATITATSVADPTISASKPIKLDKKADSISFNIESKALNLNINDKLDLASLITVNGTIEQEYTLEVNSDATTITGTTLKVDSYISTEITVTATLNNRKDSDTLKISVNSPFTGLTLKDGANEAGNFTLKLSQDPSLATKTLTANVTTNYSGVTYRWTSSNDAVSLNNNGNTCTVEARKADTSTVTVTVTASYLGYESSKSVDVTVEEEVEKLFGYSLVTSTSELKAGDLLIIGSSDKNSYAGALNNSVLKYETCTFDSNKKIITSSVDKATVFTLGGSAGSYTLTNNAGQKLGATAEKKLAFDGGTNTWKITIESNYATIQNTNSKYGYFLCNYNGGTERYTTYTSSINKSIKPQLFKYQEIENITQSNNSDATFDPSNLNLTNASDAANFTVNSNITINFNKGTNNSNGPKYYTEGKSIRCYGGNYFEVIGSTNITITKITITFGSGEETNAITSSNGTLSSNVWTGSSNTVKFTIGGTSGQRRIQKLVIEYEN